MDNLERWHTRRDAGYDVVFDPLHLDPKALAVGNDEAEVPDLRNVDARIVHFIDDAEAQREPESRFAQGAPDHILCTARPSRRNAGCSGRVVKELIWHSLSTAVVAILAARADTGGRGPTVFVP